MTRSILLICYFAPSCGHAGGLRLLELYQQIKKIQPQINLELVTCHHPNTDWHIEDLDSIFCKIYWLSPEEYCFTAIENLGVLNHQFDIIDLQYHKSGRLIDGLKRKFKNTTILFTPMESMIRAAKLYLDIDFKHMLFKRFCGHILRAFQEAYYVMRVTKVICVSDPDRESLLLFKNSKDIISLPTGVSSSEFFAPNVVPFCDKSIKDHTLVFVAYFGSRTNNEALVWFIKSVHPLIKKAKPEYLLNVVGRGADQELISACQLNGIHFIGEVESIADELSHACVGIALALTGAGLRGKINQYAAAGLPCVATSLAASGLKYEADESILIADNPNDFANHCVKLLNEKEYCLKMGQEAKLICLANYSWESMKDNIEDIYNLR